MGGLGYVGAKASVKAISTAVLRHMNSVTTPELA
jgi:hypothetical protein